MLERSPTKPTRWELYKLLSEPLRLRLLALCAEDELAISELAELLSESQPNVSRHATTLRHAGLLSTRKQGTWTLLRLEPDATQDLVVADALSAGRELCRKEGLLRRVSQVLRARDSGTREFFARNRERGGEETPTGEWAAYIAALSLLLPSRKVAVDAGAGDGAALDVLAPAFEHVYAVDRSEAQLSAARERVRTRGHHNVTLVCAELEPSALAKSIPRGADLVLAARVLHHAPRPAETVRTLAGLLSPGGTLLILEYARHDDLSLRSEQADLWLGFERAELESFFAHTGLTSAGSVVIPAPYRGNGPDQHLEWLVTAARRSLNDSQMARSSV
ncbi:MAG: metalloregulator ArsR/SmtB family transcription factor [Deltaproteobacteria bacterium]|nr:metalloregulator ArsR/SmtB family transcription factor [Deltaproteobacteria bacterium]